MEDIKLIHGDSLQALKGYADNHFDLAIVDPPYGIVDKTFVNKGAKALNEMLKWDKELPTKEYFNELFRVSKNQIVWGGNYFDLPIREGWLCWDKTINGKTFFIHAAKFELIWTSLDIKPEFIRYASNGNVSGFKPKPNYNYKNDKIDHPAHKPADIYKWLLTKYAKQGDLILDTHVGSASSLIACEDMGFEYVGFEIDKDYFDSANKRLEQFRSQLKLDI